MITWFGSRADASGIASERDFVAAVYSELKRCERSGQKFVLAVAAVRTAETNYGTAALRSSVARLRNVIRDIDRIGWYEDGRALALLFPHADGNDIQVAVRTIRAKIDASFRHADVPLQLPVSLYILPSAEGPGARISALNFSGKGLVGAPRVARIVKRSIDLIGSLIGFVVLSPVLITVAALIKLTSEGPVLFRQIRIGRNGRPFTFVKFRSMYFDCDGAVHRDYVARLITNNGDNTQGEEHVYKIVDDPRVTRLGRILRRTSLDELPQLANVLKGDMSLIGPRPPLPYEVDLYEPWHSRRLQVKPGITGLWQVSGRSKTSFEEMVRLDLRYVRDWSLLLDIKILLRTPVAVISGDGAY